jgi:hypothetical protein
MADTAAHLVDRVLPRTPVRQWVLSLPFRLRYRMAFDSKLTADILRIFVRRIFASLRRRARRHRRLDDPRCGAVTFIQRFGGSLNLNVHFHTLAVDGVFVPRDRRQRFLPLPPPGDAEIARIAATTLRAIVRLLERRGLTDDADPDQADPLAQRHPLLASLCAASVRGRIATGPRAGQEILRFGDRVDVDHLPTRKTTRCVHLRGLSIHANVAVPANDRNRLERLCRYAARPPVASERLSQLPDGRLLYALKHRWRDGTTHVCFTRAELMERLAALIPPPRFNLVRYHGVLAPAAKDRAAIVPSAATEADCPCPPPGGVGDEAAQAPRPRNYSWAELMRRVFEVDVLECPSCGGRMKVLATIHPPHATRAILECLSLPARAPPIAPPPPDATPDPWHIA